MTDELEKMPQKGSVGFCWCCWVWGFLVGWVLLVWVWGFCLVLFGVCLGGNDLL